MCAANQHCRIRQPNPETKHMFFPMLFRSAFHFCSNLGQNSHAAFFDYPPQERFREYKRSRQSLTPPSFTIHDEWKVIQIILCSLSYEHLIQCAH